MHSNREYAVLQQLQPRQVICHVCLAKFAAALPGEPDPASIRPRDLTSAVREKRWLCGQFSPIVSIHSDGSLSKEKAAKNLP